MPIRRVLERDDEQLVLTATNRDNGGQMMRTCQKRFREGGKPTTPPKAVLPFVAGLRKYHVDPLDLVVGLTDAELEIMYADQIERGEKIKEGVLTKRPTRALFAYLLRGQGGLNLKAAMKTTAKNPVCKAWMIEELHAALANQAGFANETSRLFAERWSTLLGAPAPAAPVTDTSSQEAKLLAAIAEAPDDDGPREVYADWLIDRGNPFGEVIHAAIAAHADDMADKTTRKTARARELEKKYAKAWLAPIKPFARSTSFRGGRGLLAMVRTHAEAFLQASDAIIARAPRAELYLEGVKKQHIAPLAAARLGSFKSLVLNSQRLDDAQLAQLVHSPTFAGVEELDVANAHFRDAGVLAIATSRNVSGLRRLDMNRQYGPHTNASVSPATLAALFSSKQLPALRELVVFGTSFAGAFVRSSLQLRSLTIVTATFTNADAAELAGAKSLAKLEHLEIRGTTGTRFEVDKPTLAAVASTLKKLESFSVRGAEIRLRATSTRRE